MAGLLAAALLLPTIAWTVPFQDAADGPQRLVLRPGSRLWLEGDSNLHDWSCDAERLVTEIEIEAGEEDGVPRPTAVRQASVRVPVATIACGNGTMEGKLRDALKAERFPEIVFRTTSAETVAEVVDGIFSVRAEGTLTVAGVSRPVELQVSASHTADGGLRIQGRLPLRMTDFGVEPPSALLGVLKTDDELTVLFDLSADYVETGSTSTAGAARGGERR